LAWHQLSASSFAQCQLLNQSVCEPIAETPAFAGVVYNLEAQEVMQSLRIPVCCKNLAVFNATGGVVESATFPAHNDSTFSPVSLAVA